MPRSHSRATAQNFWWVCANSWELYAQTKILCILGVIFAICNFKTEVWTAQNNLLLECLWTLYTAVPIYCLLYTIHFTLHTANGTLNTAHGTLHAAQCTYCTLYTIHFTLQTACCTLHVHYSQPIVHCTLNTAHRSLLTAQCTSHTAVWVKLAQVYFSEIGSGLK